MPSSSPTSLCASEALPLRIGVHLGDVFVTANGDLLGHGVNIAARLQQQAEPHGALVSIDVRRALRGPIAEKLRPKGLLKLDKMAETIEAFALVAARTAAPTGRRRKEPLLAVLPFDNHSGDPETLSSRTACPTRSWKPSRACPASRSSGAPRPFTSAASESRRRRARCMRRHVLDGSVRRLGSRMRIHAQLTEGESGTLLWGEKYDCDIADAFSVQDTIAAQVALALQQALPQHKRPTPKIDHVAYDLYLRARPMVKDLAEADARRAEPMLQQAIARAPDFAQAWAALAMARSLLLPRDSDAEGDPAHEAALAAANRALALDPECADALVALAVLKPAFAEHADKLQLCEDAVKLAPNDPLGRGGVRRRADLGRARARGDDASRGGGAARPALAAVRLEPRLPFAHDRTDR